jgi:hypothetical protein
LWTTTKFPHGYETGTGESTGEEVAFGEPRKPRKPRKPSGESRPRQSSQPQAKQTEESNVVASHNVYLHFGNNDGSSPSQTGEDSACSTAAGGGSRAGSPAQSGGFASPKGKAAAAKETQQHNPNYDLVGEGLHAMPEVEKLHNRKTMQLLAEGAFPAAPNLLHILQLPSQLPSDKNFGASAATICIQDDESGENDPELASYLGTQGPKDGHQGQTKSGRQSALSMLTVPTMGPDGKPYDFRQSLFGRSSNNSPVMITWSRAISPSSFLPTGGLQTMATTLNCPMPMEPAAKLPSRLSSTSSGEQA